MTDTPAAPLELDDIQSGALHERPSPYAGTYLLLRIDDRAAGRELVRRLHDIVDTGRPSSDPARDAWITAAFTYRGLEALGVPQSSLDSFAPEFREGMAARAALLGDVGDSGPEHWEKPLGSSEVHVALAALSRDAARLQKVVERARRAHEELAGVEVVWQQDCYQLPSGRTSFGFKDGIGQPAVEGSAIPGSNPDEPPVKAGEFILGYPDETGSVGPMPAPEVLGRNGTYLVFRKCTPGWPPTGSTCAPGRPARGRSAARGQDGRPLAKRRPARAVPRAGRSRSGRRPWPEQPLRLRR